jgi:hypothetical protein
MENNNIRRNTGEMYDFINANGDEYLKAAQESGLGEAEAELTLKAARELDKEDFITFLIDGELSGTLSLTDQEMSVLQGGGDNNTKNYRFCCCCCCLS